MLQLCKINVLMLRERERVKTREEHFHSGFILSCLDRKRQERSFATLGGGDGHVV